MWVVPVCDIVKVNPSLVNAMTCKKTTQEPFKESTKSLKSSMLHLNFVVRSSKLKSTKLTSQLMARRKSRAPKKNNGKLPAKKRKAEDDGLSEYERMMQRNREEKMAFLKTLQIDKIYEQNKRKNVQNHESPKKILEEIKEDNFQDHKTPKKILEEIKKDNFQDHQSPKKDDGLSEYERMIRRNRDDKMAFLQSLHIDEIKQDLADFVNQNGRKGTKGIPKKKIKPSSPPVKRQSLRLSKEKKVDLSEEAVFARSVAVQSESYSPKVEKPPTLTFEEALVLDDKTLCKGFADMYNLAKEKDSSKAVIKCNSMNFSSMRLDKSNIAKVVMARITSMAVHPSSSKILISVGSKYGQIGFWDVECNSDHDRFYLCEPHSGNVACQAFNPENSNQLFSCSYDGSFRCCDLEKMVFDEVYHSVDDIFCTSFDFISSTTFLIAQRNGEVVVVDTRSKRKTTEKKHQSHDCPLKTVSSHPVDKSYFITAGNNGVVHLWDLRNLQTTSIATILHSRCVNSAYFSPVTGNRILTTSTDDKISIFDSTFLTNGIKLIKAISHNNYVTRWLTCFQANWLPKNEELFQVGSMLQPRRIEIYNVNGDIQYNFKDDNLNSVTSVNAFHPSRPVLCGGNSCGKCFTFIGSE